MIWIIAFDFNSKPYMSAIVSQIELGNQINVYTIKEYALEYPQNTTADVCRTILSDFEQFGIDSIYFYGDSTGKSKTKRINNR